MKERQVEMRSATGGLILPLCDAYDRQLLFEHIADRVRRVRWVDVSAGAEHWRATLRKRNQHTPCTRCGDALTIAHESGGNHLCTRCQMRALH
jgi:hypothetical protein